MRIIMHVLDGFMNSLGLDNYYYNIIECNSAKDHDCKTYKT